MSRGGSAPGWGWWPPSRRRGRQQQRARRRAAAGFGFLEGAWAFPVAVLAVAGLAAASLSLLVLVLGLSGAALSLIVAAAAAGSWIVSSGLGGGSKDRRGTPLLTHRISFASKSNDTVLANGGPSMSYSSPGLLVPERRRGQVCGDYLSPSTRFTLTPRRRYPIQQAQYAVLGTLPSVCWDEHRRKNRLSIHHSSIAHSPVTVKIARPESSIGRSPLLEQLVSPVAFSPASNTILDPCAKETVLNALKESRKRTVEEEEEDQNFPNGQENKKRRHDSTGSGHSAFEPLMANGAPASLVPKPGSLKRGLVPSHCLEDCSSKRSRTSSLSSVNSLSVGGIPSSIRNAIASSYSSTRGLSQLWKRTGPSSSPLSSPASSRSQTPERPNKKVRYPSSNITEEEPQKSNSQMPVTADRETQEEKISESPLKNKCNYVSSPSSSGSNGKRKRKIQLLSAHHGDNFALPPPPQLGYTVTPEDLDAEKKATLQWFNKILEENIDSTPSAPVETTSSSQTLNFSLISAKPTPVSLPISTAATNPLLESLKNMQEGKGSSAEAAKTVPGTTGSPQIPAFSASLDLSSSVAVTSPKPLTPNVPISLSAASPPSGASLPTSSAGSLVTASSEPGHTPARPSSAPKPSILLGILTSPLADKPPAATMPSSSAPSTVPVFKPVFGSPAKSENFGFSTSGTTVVSATAQSVPSMAPPVAPSGMFKPIFGSLSAPATSVLPTNTSSSPFAFSQAPQPAASSGLPAINASSSLGLPVLPDATVTTSVSPPGTASVTFVSMSKPVFSFGPGIPSSAASPNNNNSSSSSSSTPATVVSTLASQPLLFGAAPSASTAAMPLFQFGKQAAPTGATVNLLAPSGTTNSAPTITAAAATTTNTGFGIFSGGSSSSAQASSASSATTQAPLTFGSCTSAFSSTFGAASKPPPPYPAVTSQLAFDSGVSEGQQGTLKPPAAGPLLNFGTPFSFTGSVAQPAAQPAFGSSTQTPFGGASFGAKSTSQPAFGVASSVFPFGTATASGTPTTSSSTGSSVFGSSAPAPFTFGASNPSGVAGSAFGVGASATGTGVPTVGFSFGSGQSGAAEGVTPFGTSLAPNPLGAQNQNSAFAFSTPNTPENKLAFGGTPTPTFGQSTPTPGGGNVGSCNLSFGTPITPAFGGMTPAFGPATAAFSIGAGSKTGTRQRVQARRQHTRKK
ncbi:nuclear envelope pore membrane protein POM 121 [Pseudonaja textilis]|uniref:nuclear envelope pore membrane protein POM 121 n=1 Tax=Pseudonaja textilis TaxID=8673 RepID=UPI000EA9F557|nr:nuclear envelope pore membrane protein POM 121 [Pseudonaja textilis]